MEEGLKASCRIPRTCAPAPAVPVFFFLAPCFREFLYTAVFTFGQDFDTIIILTQDHHEQHLRAVHVAVEVPVVHQSPIAS